MILTEGQKNLRRLTVYLYWSFCFLFFRADMEMIRWIPERFTAEGSLGEACSNLILYAQKGIFERKPYVIFFFGSLLFAFLLLSYLDRAGEKAGTSDPLSLLGDKGRWFCYISMSILVLLFYFLTTSTGASVSFLYKGY